MRLVSNFLAANSCNLTRAGGLLHPDSQAGLQGSSQAQLHRPEPSQQAQGHCSHPPVGAVDFEAFNYEEKLSPLIFLSTGQPLPFILLKL